MTRARSGRDDRRVFDPIQLGKVACQVRVPLGLDAALVGAAAAWGALAISRIEPVHDVHALENAAERGEPHAVQPAVVTVVDEELRGARARAAGREAHHAACVMLAHRIVRDARVAPHGRHVRIAVNPELRHESRDHPEEPAVIVITALHQVVEPVGAERRPIAMHLDHEVAGTGLEARAEGVRGALPHAGTRGSVEIRRAGRGRGRHRIGAGRRARTVAGAATLGHEREGNQGLARHGCSVSGEYAKINGLARRTYPVLRNPWAMPLSVEARPALAEASGSAAWQRCNNATWSSDSGSTYGLRRPIAVCSIGLSRIR